jgi:hypothetical protein
MNDYIDRSNPKFLASIPKQRTVAYPIDETYPPARAEGQALQALESVKETATPVQRAYAIGIRLIPFTVAWLVLAGVLTLALEGDLVVPFLLFAGLTAGTYFLMNRQEYEYSAAGLERYKANLEYDLKELQLKQNHALKRSALASYIKYLENDER